MSAKEEAYNCRMMFKKKKKRCKTTKRHSRDFGQVTRREGQVKKEISKDTHLGWKRNSGCSKEENSKEACSSRIQWLQSNEEMSHTYKRSQHECRTGLLEEIFLYHVQEGKVTQPFGNPQIGRYFPTFALFWRHKVFFRPLFLCAAS